MNIWKPIRKKKTRELKILLEKNLFTLLCQVTSTGTDGGRYFLSRPGGVISEDFGNIGHFDDGREIRL
jgi:hypothetical protein